MSKVNTGDAIILTGCLAWLATLFVSLAQTSTELPDFTSLDASARKIAFFDYLEPLVAEVNDRSREDRQTIVALSTALETNARLSWLERAPP